MKSRLICVFRSLSLIGVGVGLGAAMIGSGYSTDALVTVSLILFIGGMGGAEMNTEYGA